MNEFDESEGNFRRSRHVLRVLVLCLILVQAASAQNIHITKVEPPNWWTGMKLHRLQLMIYGDNLAGATATSSSPDVQILRTRHTGNASYAFVDIDLKPVARPGSIPLTMTGPDGKAASIEYPILSRHNTQGRFQGFSSADVIYLITPDRFADGDTTNNATGDMTERPDRRNPYGRHGGDIQGIINHLDYLKDLGVTAVWINPLVENNNPGSSYHGYAVTDLYRIDPRFGSNALYAQLVEAAHARGLKIILDHVNNHISSRHPWMKNLPSPDWLNGTVDSHDQTHHYKVELTDPYGDSLIRNNVKDGWFSDHMPDLNQKNPFVASYLIQNSIWWVESTGLDGIREDTFPYIDDAFRAEWCRTIRDEYPAFNIVGEVWITDPAFLAPYQLGNHLARPFDAQLPSVTDFGLFDAFMQVFGSHASISAIHTCLAKDFLYPNPSNLVTFVDNHDVARIMEVTGGNAQRSRLALALLLTTRGTPEIFYGTEIGMRGARDDGRIRSDFPGGFPGDSLNAFTARGRTASQDSMFQFVRSLLRIRKEHPALRSGSLVQFPPVEEVYMYVRSSGREKIVVIANNGADNKTVKLGLLRDQLGSAGKLKNLFDGRTVSLADTPGVEVAGNSAEIFEAGKDK